MTFLGLNPDEALYFLHIPKTAGGTLIYTLDNYFDQSEIFPALVLSELLETPHLLEQLNHCRFIRGHFDAITLSLIRRPLKVFTFLRNPVERALSQFSHASRHPEVAWWDDKHYFNNKITLDDFLHTPEADEFMANIQVQSLTSEWTGMEKLILWDAKRPCLPDNIRLVLAKQRLDACAVVGIQERFDDSLRLLAYTFGFPMPEQVKNYNVGTERVKSDSLNNAVTQRLHAMNHLDAALYGYGLARFERDYQHMRQALDRKFPHLNGDPDAQLAADYEQRFQEKATAENTTSARREWRYDFAHSMVGTNWYRREPFQNRFFRWTGPDTISTLKYDLPPDHVYRVEIETLGSVNAEALESFRFRINNEEIPLQRENSPVGPVFKGTIPHHALGGQSQHTLMFIVDKPVKVETRTLGISVLSLRFVPVTEPSA